MATDQKPTKKQVMADINALMSYTPRAQAIEWIFSGQFDRYIDWSFGEGYEAAEGKKHGPVDEVGRYFALTEPMSLDKHLFYSKIKKADGRSMQSLAEIAFEKVHLFGQSPLEMLLRGGSDEAFDALLKYLISPKARFAFGWRFDRLLKNACGVWKFKFSATGDNKLTYAFSERDSNFLILLLAVMIGRKDRADLMVKRGLQPSDWYRVGSDVNALRDLPGELLASLMGVESSDLDAALSWIDTKTDLSDQLDEAVNALKKEPADFQHARTSIAALVEKCPAIGYYPLAIASETGDLETLKLLFEYGGNPNCYYKTGVPMLARLDASKLDSDILQAWLAAGVDPGTPTDSSSFISGSAIEGFVHVNKLNLVEQCYEGAAGKVELRPNFNGKSYSPLLSLALDHSHKEIALWLMRKGCKLSDLDDMTGNKCSSFGDAMLIADIKSIIENKTLRKTTPSAKTPKKTLRERTDIM